MSEQDTRNTRKIINEIRASFGASPTTMTDDQIEAGREVYGAKLDYDVVVFDEVQDTRERLEVWAHDEIAEKWAQSDREVTMIMDDLHDLLDRQAAITANETNHNNPYVGLVRGKQWERTEISDYYCGRCGWKVTDHDSYCPECGGALHKASNKPNSQSDVLKTAETAENATSKDEIHDFDDSREQLEADVRTFFSACDDGLCFCANGEEYFIELLDRQAAITRRECERPNWDYCETCEALAELTAERDELQAAIDAMGNGQFYAMYRKACDERDHFKELAITKQTK